MMPYPRSGAYVFISAVAAISRTIRVCRISLLMFRSFDRISCNGSHCAEAQHAVNVLCRNLIKCVKVAKLKGKRRLD